MMSVTEAMEVVRRHQAGDLPVQMVPLANELGIEVYRVPGWPNELSGMIARCDDTESGFEIFVNGEHPEVRRRFTIAHECAHAILHTDLIGDGITDDALYRSGLSSRVEAQANRLAADILMPRHRLDELIAAGVTSVEHLARRFNVSSRRWRFGWELRINLASRESRGGKLILIIAGKLGPRPGN